jgi:hypothetical protein
MIGLAASAGVLFGIIAAVDANTVNRLPRWIQWAGSLSFGAGLVVIALRNS